MEKPQLHLLKHATLSNPDRGVVGSNEEMLKSYVQIVKRLLETYATEDIFAEADTNIVRFTQPTNMSPSKYAMQYG